LDARRFDLEIQREFLPNGQRHRRVLEGGKVGLHRLNRVGGWLQVTDQEVPLIVRHSAPLFSGAFILHRHSRTGHERAALVADRSADLALVGLGVPGHGAHRDQTHRRNPSVQRH
jgi:hypothetical protein